MIELLHWRAVSHSAKVLICLHEIGVDYKSTFVDLLAFEQFSDEFLQLNSLGQVPVLRENGETLTESSLINEYLAESRPDAGLAPTDARGWYECQAWSKYIDYNLSSSLGTLGCSTLLTPLLAERDHKELLASIAAIPVAERRPGWEAAATGIDEESIANSKRKAQLVIERMEAVLADTEWLIGDDYSIADINTFAMLHSLVSITPDLLSGDVAPNSLAWFERIASRSAVSEALAVHADVDGFAPGPEHSRWG